MDEQNQTRGPEYLPSKSVYFKNCQITRYLHTTQIRQNTALIRIYAVKLQVLRSPAQ